MKTPAYLFHTDNREPLAVKGRQYGYYDARDPERLSGLINALLNKDGFCVIDSGGNRPDFDKWIANTVDLILIPVTPDQEAVKEGLAHEERLREWGAENIRFLLNRYPANKNEQELIHREFFHELPDSKIIGKVSEIKAVRMLNKSDFSEANPDGEFKTLPTKVNNLARNLFLTVREEIDRIKKEEQEAA